MIVLLLISFVHGHLDLSKTIRYELQLLASAACNESLPGCSDCAYQSFCGADPVRNYATQDDVIGNRAEGNGFCKKYMALIKHLLALDLIQ
jgi:hypothetical protein